MLTNDVLSFEKLGADCSLCNQQLHFMLLIQSLYDIPWCGKYKNAELQCIMFFFCYKMEFFFFQNSFKDLDPSYKMDLDLWDCLGRVKLVL